VESPRQEISDVQGYPFLPTYFFGAGFDQAELWVPDFEIFIVIADEAEKSLSAEFRHDCFLVLTDEDVSEYWRHVTGIGEF
jgi:hypothetical protein